MTLDQQTTTDLPSPSRDRDDDLELSEVFEILQNQRRRRVLRYLTTTADGRATLSDLAEHVAGLENDVDPAHLSSSQRKRVYVGLYQAHLPKLDDYGVVDFDKNRGTVVLDDTSDLDPYFEYATGVEATNGADTQHGEADDPMDADTQHGDAHDPMNADDPMDADDPTDADEAEATTAADDQRDLYLASVTTVVVLLGLAGLGPLSAVSGGFWTVVSLAALLWIASR